MQTHFYSKNPPLPIDFKKLQSKQNRSAVRLLSISVSIEVISNVSDEYT